MIIMYITSGISIRNDVYYNHMDTRYSINYRVRVVATLSKTLINRAFRDMHGSTATKLLLKPVAPISARCSNKSYIGLYFR